MVQTTKTRPTDGPRGQTLLDDPVANKGTAFTAEERREYGLEGLLPHAVESLDRQLERVMGLATYAARPRRITDACFIAAAEASADQVGPDLRAKGMLFPSQADILETEVTTATRVAEFMFDEGLAQNARATSARGSRASLKGAVLSAEGDRITDRR